MSEEPQPESESHAGRWVLWIVAVLVLYVLSPGPVVVAMVKMRGPRAQSKVLEVVYTPLIFVMEKSPPLERGMESYIAWWLKVCGVVPSF